MILNCAPKQGIHWNEIIFNEGKIIFVLVLLSSSLGLTKISLNQRQIFTNIK